MYQVLAITVEDPQDQDIREQTASQQPQNKCPVLEHTYSALSPQPLIQLSSKISYEALRSIALGATVSSNFPSDNPGDFEEEILPGLSNFARFYLIMLFLAIQYHQESVKGKGAYYWLVRIIFRV